MEKGTKKLPRGIALHPVEDGHMYRARIYVDGIQYHLGNYFTLSDAQAALAIARAQKARGTFIPPAQRRKQIKELRAQEKANALTVKKWAELWLENLSQLDPPRSPGTIASYRSTLNAHVLDRIGDMQLGDVTPTDVANLVTEVRKRGVSASRNVARTLKAMFYAAIAAQAGGITTNPVKVEIGGKGGSRARTDDEVPTLEEIASITHAMPDNLRLAVSMAAYLGLRIGEVLGLQRGDFTNLDKPAAADVRIRRQWLSKATPPDYGPPKDDSYRTLPIPSALLPKVINHLASHVAKRADAPLFPSTRDNSRPMSHNAFARRWNEARDTVRPGLAFHSLRHFHLTEYRRRGATDVETMRQGGHRDHESATRYQHGSDQRARELAERLNDLITVTEDHPTGEPTK